MHSELSSTDKQTGSVRFFALPQKQSTDPKAALESLRPGIVFIAPPELERIREKQNRFVQEVIHSMQTPNTNQPPEQQGYQPTNQPQNQQGYQPYPQQNPQGYPGYPPQNQQFYQSIPQQPVQGYPGYLQPIPQEAPKKKHSKAWIAIPVTLAVLALGYFGVRWVLDNRIVPVAKPVVDPDNSGKQTVTETTGENRDEPPIEQEARTISLPVNPALPTDVAVAFETLSDLTESFTPEGDGYVYKDEDTEVTLTVVPPETVEKEVGPVSAKTEEKAAPSVVTGKSGNTA